MASLAYIFFGETPRDERGLMAVAMQAFNMSAILLLFKTLYALETKSNAELGEALRNNVGTIGPALLLSFIFTALGLASMFGLEFS
ncbi:hypothetical protein L5849_07165 [Erythrobacter sp. SN021]|uniref:hypothetical protein n=1 Tax=Erythrobacter sp. SN021 TaxID=2912574 RepID=UPI001F17A10B|nr:hypothetical protein [Erythrobacter sp. SN021]MCF8882475.1 hypothetical protein [Erythrobacter sp. SN021]